MTDHGSIYIDFEFYLHPSHVSFDVVLSCSVNPQSIIFYLELSESSPPCVILLYFVLSLLFSHCHLSLTPSLFLILTIFFWYDRNETRYQNFKTSANERILSAYYHALKHHQLKRLIKWNKIELPFFFLPQSFAGNIELSVICQ